MCAQSGTIQSHIQTMKRQIREQQQKMCTCNFNRRFYSMRTHQEQRRKKSKSIWSLSSYNFDRVLGCQLEKKRLFIVFLLLGTFNFQLTMNPSDGFSNSFQRKSEWFNEIIEWIISGATWPPNTKECHKPRQMILIR